MTGVAWLLLSLDAGLTLVALAASYAACKRTAGLHALRSTIRAYLSILTHGRPSPTPRHRHAGGQR